MAKKIKTSKKSAVGSKPTKHPKKATTSAPVKAKFTLKSLSSRKPRSPDATRAAVQRIVQQAETASGTRSLEVKTYPNVESFAVSGSPELVESLAKHKEVASKLPDVSSDDVMIRPVRKKKVNLKRPSRPRGKK